MSQPLRIRPSGALSGVVKLPGDKSLSHRALIFSAIASGESHIGNLLHANVTDAMIDCLRGLGVSIDLADCASPGSANAVVRGCGLRGFKPPGASLDCRGSATTMRLLAGILAGQSFESTLDGHSALRRRPMGRLAKPLSEMGAHIRTDNGSPPLSFMPASLHGVEVTLEVASAQVKSALMLAGLYAEGCTSVTEPSVSRDHTERMFREFFLPVEEQTTPDGSHTVRVQGPVESIQPFTINLPSDPSSAAFLVVAASIMSGSRAFMPGVLLNPGRVGLFETLDRMGADLTITNMRTVAGESVGDITARSAKLHACDLSGEVVPRMIDEFPIFAVAATQAAGETVVRDARELRYKESDRINTLARELNKMGAGIVPKEDGFVIRGPVQLRGATVDAGGDHRLAMSLTVAALMAERETEIHGWEALTDSFPHFIHTLRLLGADIP